MAKYNFPLTEEAFRSALSDKAKQVFARLGDQDDPIGKAYQLLQHGYLSRLYHKDSMGKTQAENKLIRAAMRKDPSVKQRLLALAGQKTGS